MPDFQERSSKAPASVPFEVWTPVGAVKTQLVNADSLVPGRAVDGAAMIEGYSSTLWVPPGWQAERDVAGNVIMRRGERHGS